MPQFIQYVHPAIYSVTVMTNGATSNGVSFTVNGMPVTSAPESITVTYPQAGNVLVNGDIGKTVNTIANIQWTSSNIPAGEGVGIALFKSDGATLVKYIATNIPNTGSYAWTAIPQSRVAITKFRFTRMKKPELPA